MRNIGGKMKKIVGLFLAVVLMVSGCSNSGKKGGSVTCSMEQEGSQLRYDLGYNEDKILKTMKGTVMVTSDKEIADEEMKLVESLYSSMFDDVEGIKYSIKLADNKKDITIIIDIDLSKYDAENDELSMFASLDEEEREEITNVNIEDIVKEFEGQGAECSKVK